MMSFSQSVVMDRRFMIMGALDLAVMVAATGTRLLRATTAPTQKGARPVHDLGWIPFELVTGDTLVVHAEAAGTSVRAILDTGSAASVIDASFAKKVGLNGVERRTVRGNSGRAAVKIIRDIDIVWGGEPLRLPFALVGDLGTLSLAYGRSIEVVLGQDALAGRVIAIDFARRRYRMRADFHGGKGWVPVPVTPGANRELVVSGSVAGLPPASLILDLGSSTPLMLSRTYVDEHRLLVGHPHSTAALGGVEGVRTAATMMTSRAEIGGLPLHSIPTLVVDNWLSVSAVGNIGLPLIAQFEIVLDLSASKLWLRPLAAPAVEMLKDRSGLGLAVSDNALTVVHVAVESPAARRGWSLGERITEVNGQPIDVTYTRGRLWHWRYGPAGTLVKLKVAGAGYRELRLADYY